MKSQLMRRVLLCAILHSRVSSAAAAILTYEDFIRQVDAGNVISVTIDSEGKIAGTYHPGGKAPEPYETIGYEGSPANDPLLARLLASKGLTPALPPALLSGKETAAITMAIAFPLLLLAWMIKIHWTLKSISKRLPPGPGW